MTSNGVQEVPGKADFFTKVIGVLVTLSLAILAWAFSQWGETVADSFDKVLVQLNKIEARGEARDERLNDLTGEVLVIRERQTVLRETLDKHVGTHP